MILHTAAERCPTSPKASVLLQHFPRLFTGMSVCVCVTMDRITSLQKFPQDFLSDESFLNIVP